MRSELALVVHRSLSTPRLNGAHPLTSDGDLVRGPDLGRATDGKPAAVTGRARVYGDFDINDVPHVRSVHRASLA
jgi:hypothetical protein